MNDLRVGKKWRHIKRGRKLRERAPYLYNTVLGWCDVEAEADIIRDAYDEEQRDAKRRLDETAHRR